MSPPRTTVAVDSSVPSTPELFTKLPTSAKSARDTGVALHRHEALEARRASAVVAIAQNSHTVAMTCRPSGAASTAKNGTDHRYQPGLAGVSTGTAVSVMPTISITRSVLPRLKR